MARRHHYLHRQLKIKLSKPFRRIPRHQLPGKRGRHDETSHQRRLLYSEARTKSVTNSKYGHDRVQALPWVTRKRKGHNEWRRKGRGNCNKAHHRTSYFFTPKHSQRMQRRTCNSHGEDSNGPHSCGSGGAHRSEPVRTRCFLDGAGFILDVGFLFERFLRALLLWRVGARLVRVSDNSIIVLGTELTSRARLGSFRSSRAVPTVRAR
jgi:hypothetical protein